MGPAVFRPTITLFTFFAFAPERYCPGFAKEGNELNQL